MKKYMYMSTEFLLPQGYSLSSGSIRGLMLKFQ